MVAKAEAYDGNGSRTLRFLRPQIETCIPAWAWTGSVTWGKALNLSGPQYPPLEMETSIVPTQQGCHED